ncbi:MAG: hypothetical protein GXO50_05585 [Chlorobi bacterium]|nr:hypothetical protein [Chlorobiota bacterium]
MKKIAAYFMILSALTLFACADGKLFSFYVNDSTTVTVNGSIAPVDVPVDIATPDITTSSESEFEDNGTSVNLVKEIVLKELVLTITSPDGEDFSFLKNIHIYISTDEDDSDDETEIAWLDDISSDATSISLNVAGDDVPLDKYVKQDSYSIRTEVTTRETLNHDVDIQIDMKFRVTADPL